MLTLASLRGTESVAIVIISVENQAEQTLTSIDGIAFTASLQTRSELIVQQSVSLEFASLTVPDIPPNQYVALVYHPSVEPNVAFLNFEVATGNELIVVLFVYLEPERALMTIRCYTES